MKIEALEKILNNLEGLEWFLIAGFAIEVYTKGKRVSGSDIDLVVHEKDIDEFARRLGVKVKRRELFKNGYEVNDLFFETVFEGQEIEVTSGYPKKRMDENTFNKLFKMKVKKNYLSLDLWLAPVEEIVVLKTSFNREKDKNDLKLLKEVGFDMNLVKELSMDCDVEDKVLEVLE